MTSSDGGVLLLVVTDGRAPYLMATLAAFHQHVTGPISHRVIHDDSGDPEYTTWLRHTFPEYRVVTPGLVGSKAGFAGAIRSAWRHIATMGGYEWVFHLEEDFAFCRDVDLADVVAVLEGNPHLTQMGFRRQAWYDGGEHVVGGWCELHPDRMQQRTDGEHRWLEHDLLFTTNPSLYRRGVTKLGWPVGVKSEDRFWMKLKDLGLPWGICGADVRSAMWGDMESGAQWVEHIGHHRTGHTY